MNDHLLLVRSQGERDLGPVPLLNGGLQIRRVGEVKIFLGTDDLEFLIDGVGH